MDEADRAALLAQVRDFLRARPETSGGEFVLPMVTVVLRAQRNQLRQPAEVGPSSQVAVPRGARGGCPFRDTGRPPVR